MWTVFSFHYYTIKWNHNYGFDATNFPSYMEICNRVKQISRIGTHKIENVSQFHHHHHFKLTAAGFCYPPPRYCFCFCLSPGEKTFSKLNKAQHKINMEDQRHAIFHFSTVEKLSSRSMGNTLNSTKRIFTYQLIILFR